MLLKCPDCYALLDEVNDLDVGDILYCSACDKEFELATLKPARLKPIGSWNAGQDDSKDEDYYN